MGIGLNAQCLECHFRRNVEMASRLGTQAQATAFAKDLMRLYLSAPEDVSSPWLGPPTTALFDKYFHLGPDRFAAEKKASNRYVLARMDDLRASIRQSPDPLLRALELAVLGNYIDFGALQNEVSFDRLDEMLHLEVPLDEQAVAALWEDCRRGKQLLYLTDNAGEIGFDRLFAEELQKNFAHLSITFCVRGGPAANDATREDAQAVQISFPVIDNGNTVAGTELSQLSPQAKSAMDSADVILSKGQGNAETLLGCGYNIYYAFLAKCPRFCTRFQVPRLTPMLLRERGQMSFSL